MKEIIIARSYDKFFNLNEREETRLKNLNREELYPMRVIKKYNGYLGILSVYKGKDGELKWWISSKTSPNGLYAEKFKKMITPFLTDELKEKIYKDNVTLTFEVVDPEFDPHIEEYKNKALYLLDVISKEIDFKIKDNIFDYLYLFNLKPEIKNNLHNYLYLFNLKPKNNDVYLAYAKEINVIKNFKELIEFIEYINSVKPFDKKNYIEGYVFKCGNKESPFMFKLKTDWYRFWKSMRTLKDIVGKKLYPYDEEKLKRELPSIQKQLHTYEENKFLNYLIELIKNNINPIEKNIIELRNDFFEKKLKN